MHKHAAMLNNINVLLNDAAVAAAAEKHRKRPRAARPRGRKQHRKKADQMLKVKLEHVRHSKPSPLLMLKKQTSQKA
jgi:hypothetical protein